MIFQSLPNAPYMLEEVVKSISEESSSSVKLQLLSAVMKMFFKRPPECQEMLGTLLEHSIGKLIYTVYMYVILVVCVGLMIEKSFSAFIMIHLCVLLELLYLQYY
jgi:hypothetical protein